MVYWCITIILLVYISYKTQKKVVFTRKLVRGRSGNKAKHSSDRGFKVTRGINGEGNGTPLQYSCLENPMDGGAWKAAVHGVAEGRTRLSDFTLTFHFHALEKEMATHSSVLAWRIPGTGELGGLPSMGSHRVGHDWGDLAAEELNKFYFKISVFPCD